MPDQTMKAATAAKKLGIFLPACPPEFQDSPLSRDAFAQLQNTPPEWLAELRRTGPHPRPVVAQKLGVSISGLARAGVTEALTTAEIKALLQEMPQWLVTERATQAAVRAEALRAKSASAKKRSAATNR